MGAVDRHPHRVEVGGVTLVRRVAARNGEDEHIAEGARLFTEPGHQIFNYQPRDFEVLRAI
jgi:hypothetical protein